MHGALGSLALDTGYLKVMPKTGRSETFRHGTVYMYMLVRTYSFEIFNFQIEKPVCMHFEIGMINNILKLGYLEQILNRKF
jgi:hypothetical protein